MMVIPPLYGVLTTLATQIVANSPPCNLPVGGGIITTCDRLPTLLKSICVGPEGQLSRLRNAQV